MPFIVIGCGFCGTNGLVKKLMDHGIFMGSKWVQPNTHMHPYPVWEDAEMFRVQQHFGLVDWRRKLQTIVNIRQAAHGDRWGFKTPNNFRFLNYYLSVITKPVIFACVRDQPTLVKRMMERWDFSRAEAKVRIKSYLNVVKGLLLMKVYAKTVVINQKKLLEGKEDARIRELIQ